MPQLRKEDGFLLVHGVHDWLPGIDLLLRVDAWQGAKQAQAQLQRHRRSSNGSDTWGSDPRAIDAAQRQRCARYCACCWMAAGGLRLRLRRAPGVQG